MTGVHVVESTEEPTPEGVQSILEATEVVDIRVDQVEAGPVAATGGRVLARLGRGAPQYAYFENLQQFVVRLEHILECRGDTEDGPLTTLRVWHVVAFEVSADLEVGEANVAAWIHSNVYFFAYPYVRQFFTNLTGAMGMPPVVLGYMRRDDWPEFAESTELEDPMPESTK